MLYKTINYWQKITKHIANNTLEISLANLSTYAIKYFHRKAKAETATKTVSLKSKTIENSSTISTRTITPE